MGQIGRRQFPIATGARLGVPLNAEDTAARAARTMLRVATSLSFIIATTKTGARKSPRTW
jgi:hypothetical protein